MRVLFTKKNCEKCDYVKENLPSGLEIEIQDIGTAEGLAKLAWFSQVSTAETALPILVDYEPNHELLPRVREVITGAVKIKNALTAK